MGSMTTEPPKPWIETPLIFSAPVSRAAGCNIFLKLENLQPSGSFKSRGIGNMMLQALSNTSPCSSSHSNQDDVHFYCSSGGNAGLACATTAATLRRKATIVVPTSTSEFMVSKLRDFSGVEVIQRGANWFEADRYLRTTFLANQDPTSRGIYVPPFDHPDIWSGAATLVDEMAQQCDPSIPIDGIVCNVGGGGLLNGVLEGVEKHGKLLGRGQSPTILAIETVGADSLNASVKAGELVTLPGITSIATSLGATRVAEKTWEWVQHYNQSQSQSGGLVSGTVTDAEAVMGCVRLLDDARLLVEVACGATIATAYNGDLRKYLGKGLTDDEWASRNVVLIVCGGSNINLSMLGKYKEVYGV
ncbi:tryptophan synthase beta subunit-like PLP-dependent enzyme [Diplogelasinospora grovesii]|uniref:L-serine ammonia-lyase n=1 Tax=Diplogelasinospora grovesii TaxID=303347 RepID=A0AAN6NE97_9PEZI|nr:tryptophan synthase beta subunit-like PLP-dependent enzyme [Diplogelasinospora grovesii]